MKFPYHVFHNGISYAPNEEVPIEDKPVKAVETAKEEETVIEEPTYDMPEESTIVETKPKYTKTAISRMDIKSLKELGTSLGFENADELTGMDLKREIIRKLKL